MRAREVRVTFEPSGRSVYVLPGTTLLEAAGRAGIPLQTPCGGRGTCGKCRVRIVKGQAPESDALRRLLPNDQIRAGFRLACQSRVEDDVVVQVPQESRFEAGTPILTGFAGHPIPVRPVVRKHFFRLDQPTRQDARSDVTRLQDAVGKVSIPVENLRRLPTFLRSHSWQGTAVLIDHTLAALEAGDTSAQAYGIAIDLGTTTIVGLLVDLVSGEEAAVSSALNPQVAYGDDVVSRISRIRENHGALNEMQHVVLNAINSLVHQVADKAHVDARSIYEAVIAGNSTMQQIACGITTAPLGEVPFVHAFDTSLSVPATTLGLAINPAGAVFTFPQVGGFVGGDTVAGMLATNIDQTPEPTLLVDIGTNGEIVLSANGRVQATSTAAGPAFEGARIVQGMRATAGAIEKVMIKDDVLVNVIGNIEPIGLCGTALIDTVAELLRIGLIDETGRIVSPEEAPPGISGQIRRRLVNIAGEHNFQLVAPGETASGEPIYLRQQDVRELQLATGAIRAGVNILLRRAAVEARDLGAVLLAGAFGNFIRRSNARRIGLLPQVGCERIRFIGNAALLGAKMALLSTSERRRADRIQRRTEHVDLSTDASFQQEFALSMLFPDGDVDACSRAPAQRGAHAAPHRA